MKTVRTDYELSSEDWEEIYSKVAVIKAIESEYVVIKSEQFLKLSDAYASLISWHRFWVRNFPIAIEESIEAGRSLEREKKESSQK